MAKDDHFVLYNVFANFFAGDKAQKKIMKKQKFVKITEGHVIFTMHFENLKIAVLKCCENSQKSGTFRVGHGGLKTILNFQLACHLLKVVE